MADKKMDQIVTNAQIASDMSALLAATDGSIPADVKRLVGLRGDAALDNSQQWEITAVTAGAQRRYVPDGPLAPGQGMYQWMMARVCGDKLSPPAIERVEEGYYLRVIGNAICLESWLHEQGYHAAFAGSPSSVWLGARCAGKMRLQPGDYHKCDRCDYVTED